MGEAVLRIVSSFNRNCDLCHKPTKNLYRIILDGIPVMVCSEAHAIQARDNWMAKKKANISPYEKPSMEEPMMDSGSIPDEGGESL